MLTHRHCVIFVLLAGVGCATATAGDDIGYLSGTESSGATPGSGGTAPAAGTGTGPITGAGGTGADTGSVAFGGSAGVPAAGGRATATAGRSGRVGSGGTTSAAGRGSVMGGAGMAGTASSVACPAPRMPAMAGATQGNSGSFDTTDAVCYFVEGTFNNWQCSNIGGRTITVNGTPVMCGGPLPDTADGGYYFEFSASTTGTDYTSFYWYTS